MEDLEEFAKEVVAGFSREYRTIRNPEGKKCVIIYGGDFEVIEGFSYLVRRALPVEINAFVFGQENKIGLGERNKNPDAFYVDFGMRCLDG